MADTIPEGFLMQMPSNKEDLYNLIYEISKGSGKDFHSDKRWQTYLKQFLPIEIRDRYNIEGQGRNTESDWLCTKNHVHRLNNSDPCEFIAPELRNFLTFKIEKFENFYTVFLDAFCNATGQLVAPNGYVVGNRDSFHVNMGQYGALSLRMFSRGAIQFSGSLNDSKLIKLPSGTEVTVAKSLLDFCVTKLKRGEEGVAVTCEDETYYPITWDKEGNIICHSHLVRLYQDQFLSEVVKLDVLKQKVAEVAFNRMLARFTRYSADNRTRAVQRIDRLTHELKEHYRSLQSLSVNKATMSRQFKSLNQLVKDPDIVAIWFDPHARLHAIVGPLTVSYYPTVDGTEMRTDEDGEVYEEEIGHQAEEPTDSRNFGYFHIFLDDVKASALSIRDGKHPNISADNGVCLGNNQGLISRLIGQGSYAGALRYMISALTKANDFGYNRWNDSVVGRLELNDWSPTPEKLKTKMDGAIWQVVDLDKAPKKERATKAKAVVQTRATPRRRAASRVASHPVFMDQEYMNTVNRAVAARATEAEVAQEALRRMRLLDETVNEDTRLDDI